MPHKLTTATQNKKLEDGRYYSQYYQFKVNSDLVKQYEDFGHTISLESSYILPGFDREKGDFQDFFTLPGHRQELRFGGSQYFYDSSDTLFCLIASSSLFIWRIITKWESLKTRFNTFMIINGVF